MGILNQNLSLTSTVQDINDDTVSLSGKDEFIHSSTYAHKTDIVQLLDNGDLFITVMEFEPDTIGRGKLQEASTVVVHNPSATPIEIRVLYDGVTAGTDDNITGGTDASISYLLRPGEILTLPSYMACAYNHNLQSACNPDSANASFDNAVPDANMYEESDTLALMEALDDSETQLDLDDESAANVSGSFRLGDLIRIDNEVMEVEAITESTTNTLTVRRGTHGTAPAVHSDNANIRWPFFNAYADFDKYSSTQTDLQGNFKCMNFFGMARLNASAPTYGDGLVRGSISIKFYNAGFQELGLSGITSNTASGLDVGEVYYFKIAVDGGSIEEVPFTVDSDNSNFGGTNGIIHKMQQALDSKASTAGNALFERGVRVELMNGDLRFTSKQHLSTSAISLTAGTSGDTEHDLIANAIGVFPADVEAPVPASLPRDTSIVNGNSVYNEGIFLHDDGYGNLKPGSQNLNSIEAMNGQTLTGASGTIDYDSGKVVIKNAPKRASFVFSGITRAGLGMGGKGTNNIITKISARTISKKREGKVRILAFDS